MERIFHRKPLTTNIPALLSKQTAHPLQYTVLIRVVRVVFTWDLEDSGERIGEGVDTVADTLCDLSVYKYMPVFIVSGVPYELGVGTEVHAHAG